MYVDIAPTGRKTLEDRVKMSDYLRFPADHHAVAALQSPHPSAGAYVNIVDVFRGQLLCASNVVDVIRVAAVDQDVTGVERWRQIGKRLVHCRCGNHQPDAAGLGQLCDEIRQ